MPVSSEGGPEGSHGLHRYRGYVLAAMAATCWAVGGMTAKWMFSSLDARTAAWPVPPLGMDVDPVTLSAARAVTASVVLVAYLLVARREELRVQARDLSFLAIFGVVGLAAVHFTYFKTLSLTNVATAILLEYLAPVLVLLFSVVFLSERPAWTLPAGVALSVTGCALVVGAIGGEGLIVSPAGVAWGLASAVLFSVYSLMGRAGASRFTPWTLLSYGLVFAAVFWIVVLRGGAGVWELLADPRGLAAVLFVAVVGTIVPFGAFLAALHEIDATRATVTATLEPVIAGLGAYLLFGETLSASQLLGGVLVLVAIMVVQSQGLRRALMPPST